MRVLLLDGTNRNTLAIARHLGRDHGVEVDVVAHTRRAVSFYSRHVRHRIICSDPRKSEADFVKCLLQVIRERPYDLLMPVGFRTYQICAAHAGVLQEHTRLIITSASNLAVASNKNATYSLANELGLAVPRTYVLHGPDEIETLSPTMPAVIKAPFESGINIVEYAQDRSELVLRFRSLCARHGFTPPDLPLVQEYVRGEGYGYFAYYEDGKCLRDFMHHRIREYPVTGGASSCAEAWSDPALRTLGRRLLDRLRWDGVAMVEFRKRSDTGEYVLMEINAKFWGSLDLAIVCGVDFPSMLCQRALGEDVPESTDFELRRFQWILNGELFHLLDRPRALGSIVRDLFRARNDIWWSDPKPNLFQLALLVDQFRRKLRR